MGKRVTEGFKPQLKDAIPGYHVKRRFEDWTSAFETPEMPGETPEEKSMRNRQAETLAKLDEDENRRVKNVMQGTMGSRLLRNARSTARSSGASGTTASGSGGSGGVAVPKVGKGSGKEV